MNIKLFSTTAFRRTIIYAALLSLLCALILGYIHRSVSHEIESQIDARLRLETDFLVNVYDTGELNELVNAIQQRNEIDAYGRFYKIESDGIAPNDSADAVTPLQNKSVRTHTTKTMGEVDKDLSSDNPRSSLPVRVTEAQFPNGLRLVIGYEISDEQALLDRLLALVIGATFGTFILTLLGGIWINMSVAKRTASVNQTTGEISA